MGLLVYDTYNETRETLENQKAFETQDPKLWMIVNC